MNTNLQISEQYVAPFNEHLRDTLRSALSAWAIAEESAIDSERPKTLAINAGKLVVIITDHAGLARAVGLIDD